MKKDNKLPESAKRVFKGVIFEVWQWPQIMYDGSTETFEMLKRPDTAIVIPTVDDKILTLIQSQPNEPKPFTSVPGGRCDDDEDPLVAAKRELLEETGYASDEWILWKELDPVGKIVWTVYTFIAKNCYYVKPPKLDAGEKIETRLIGFNEFLNLSDDVSFSEKELKNTLLRARYESKYRDELYKILFLG
ncbi:TPA: hypothetical protein DDW69_04985 [candidate division CPR2 bacterium]|uniref:NUDIX hydrolase n=1 Tax=candidate division CPR2 bacterium GW2011_GWC1_41_48 TaxID=1618344 RepID=A0A0G0YIM4_UNCC2|nr:MAG: NUDIX hydrolase [candidate division CPR2 bacterium GW2011_GWC2_39_35]KKR27690.1 MAG: NUDIX hydrolase [candidate division CPR2 bacterium GW2011_GWD2_39_7]KKR28683.1 MAG: NUDIX hydrolase [candidate division CPR2 bacterium GW2011_GWD1_39_7]KKS09401.1 MAG: NUDIX hydrolase [candidate division CPR2 bacterium GW2011_GWC1_41_48]OGB61343.1 MAG: hypothetical protein A2Y27_00985 [candidate division CPR2 bacterium GWD1_39_7]OGB71764.1 MAG: hypothetical protein A2Y26_05420 [candidate division CPR2 